MYEVPIPDLRVGSPTRCGVLEVYPIYPEHTLFGNDVPDYLLSDEAQAAGSCAVAELPEPKVGQVLVKNTGDRSILFLEGEELVGAKQNRVLLTSIMVGAANQVAVPVFCTERGRWDSSSSNLKTGAHAPPSLRCVMKRGTLTGIPWGDGRQIEVWRFITSKHWATKTQSPKENMSDVFVNHPQVVQKLRQKLPYPEGASGIAAAINGKVVGIDLFDRAETLRKVWDRLVVMGITLDYLDLHDSDRLGDRAAKPVRLYMESVSEASWQEVPTVGAGKMFRAYDSGCLAAALVVDGTLLHLSISVPTRH